MSNPISAWYKSCLVSSPSGTKLAWVSQLLGLVMDLFLGGVVDKAVDDLLLDSVPVGSRDSQGRDSYRVLCVCVCVCVYACVCEREREKEQERVCV